MKLSRMSAVVASTAAVAAIVVGGSMLHGQRANGHPIDAAEDVQSSDTPVVIDAGSQETFTPATAVDEPTLTSDEAFTVFAQSVGSDATTPQVPATTQLGYLNMPLPAAATDDDAGLEGDTFTTYDNKLVWAYTWEQCAPPVTPVQPGGSEDTPASDEPQRCTEWTFLDATDGSHVETTWLP